MICATKSREKNFLELCFTVFCARKSTLFPFSRSLGMKLRESESPRSSPMVIPRPTVCSGKTCIVFVLHVFNFFQGADLIGV